MQIVCWLQRYITQPHNKDTLKLHFYVISLCFYSASAFSNKIFLLFVCTAYFFVNIILCVRRYKIERAITRWLKVCEFYGFHWNEKKKEKWIQFCVYVPIRCWKQIVALFWWLVSQCHCDRSQQESNQNGELWNFAHTIAFHFANEWS